jgi:hypothetical protein
MAWLALDGGVLRVHQHDPARETARSKIAQQHGTDGGWLIAGPNERHRRRLEEMIEIANGHGPSQSFPARCLKRAAARPHTGTAPAPA